MERSGAVEVFVPFSGQWIDGYELVDETAADDGAPGVWVRRQSDGSLLPEALDADRVRPAPPER
jgi:UDP-N-acetylmuramyl pentapeptide synthase